jgi:hypothetical protein
MHNVLQLLIILLLINACISQTCTNATAIRGIGANGAYQLGDTTTIERNALTSVDFSIAGSDTTFVELVNGLYIGVVRSSTGKFYSYYILFF